MKLCEKEKCTGCMACYNACPKDAIKIVIDSEGFSRPEIDEKTCVDCGKCTSVCPKLNEIGTYEPLGYYAAWAKDKRLRKESTSGGAFSVISEYVLNNGGAVVGAAFDENNRVVHKIVSTVDGLSALRGSKYVQSEIGTVYSEVKKLLDSKTTVLFSGTPCQIAGLYSFLGYNSSEYLYTVDFVCHGVPSPAVLQKYIEYMENRSGSKVDKMSFRDKRIGWYEFSMKIKFENGKTYAASTYKDPYIRGFLRDFFLRPSCHQCGFASVNKCSDISLGDFWGYVNTSKEDKDDDKGISLVIVNNQRGAELFGKVRENLHCFERDKASVLGNGGLRGSFPKNPKRDDFWQDFDASPFEDMITKYLYPEKRPAAMRKRKLAMMMPYRLKQLLRKLK